MRKVTNKKIAAVALGAVALTGTGVAYAYWTTTGTGAGSASTAAGVNETVTFSQTAAQQALGLYPGQAPQTIAGTVTNPLGAGGQAMYVTSVTASLKSVTKATGVSGTCTIDDYTIAGDPMTVNNDLVPGESASFSGQTIQFVNSASNQDGCKGATVNLAYTAS